jgi:type IV pilus assembly protein PilQ
VIGGIFVVNEGDSEVGVPWFRKIPVFGWLFKQQSIQQENRELLIFITPKIVKLS